MNILISAYACRPNQGSEPGVAWNLIQRLSRSHRLWVLTRARYQALIEEELEKRPLEGVVFVFHDLPIWMKIKNLPGGLYLYHYVWQLTIGRLGRRLHREIGFDVAHHLTLGSFRYPSGLRKVEVPLLVGPVGGAEDSPIPLWPSLGARGMMFETLRRLSNLVATTDPLVRRTYRSASRILTSTNNTASRIKRIGGLGPVEILPQIGVDPPDDVAAPMDRQGNGKLVLFIGRLVPWKGAHIALAAFRLAQRRVPELSLTFLGDGEQKPRLLKTVSTQEIKNVTFLERLADPKDVLRLYQTHDILLFPSLHDSGGMAVIEALAQGMPVVCLDIGGPAVAVTPETGYVVPPTSMARSTSELADALVDLATNEQLRTEMGAAARERIKAYAWEAKAERLSAIYFEMTGSK